MQTGARKHWRRLAQKCRRSTRRVVGGAANDACLRCSLPACVRVWHPPCGIAPAGHAGHCASPAAVGAIVQPGGDGVVPRVRVGVVRTRVAAAAGHAVTQRRRQHGRRCRTAGAAEHCRRVGVGRRAAAAGGCNRALPRRRVDPGRQPLRGVCVSRGAGEGGRALGWVGRGQAGLVPAGRLAALMATASSRGGARLRVCFAAGRVAGSLAPACAPAGSGSRARGGVGPARMQTVASAGSSWAVRGTVGLSQATLSQVAPYWDCGDGVG